MAKLLAILYALGLEVTSRPIPKGEALLWLDFAGGLYLLGFSVRVTVPGREFRVRIGWKLLTAKK